MFPSLLTISPDSPRIQILGPQLSWAWDFGEVGPMYWKLSLSDGHAELVPSVTPASQQGSYTF